MHFSTRVRIIYTLLARVHARTRAFGRRPRTSVDTCERELKLIIDRILLNIYGHAFKIFRS